MPHSNRVMPELSSGAMADIAFLLLTFYMVTTEIKDNKGLTLMLPPYQPNAPVIAKNDRNLFAIYLNSSDALLVEKEERTSVEGLREEIKTFILNNGKDKNLSDSPIDAVVSIKTDRGTTYGRFLAILDEVQGAYYEIYGQRVGLTSAAYRKLNLEIPTEKALHEKGRSGVPMNISIAEGNGVEH